TSTGANVAPLSSAMESNWTELASTIIDADYFNDSRGFVGLAVLPPVVKEALRFTGGETAGATIVFAATTPGLRLRPRTRRPCTGSPTPGRIRAALQPSPRPLWRRSGRTHARSGRAEAL